MLKKQKSEVFEDIARKKCPRCKMTKPLTMYSRDKKSKDKRGWVCRKCENRRQKTARDLAKDWKYPYKSLNDPKYLKDRNKCFKGNNGWWWGDGWWNGHHETSGERIARYKKGIYKVRGPNGQYSETWEKN